MPFKGVYCAAPQYAKNKEKFKVDIDDCLACSKSRTNPCNWTHELLTSLFDTVQDRGDHISCTTLIAKCPRSEFLSRRLDWYDHPKSLWAAFRGTMYHHQLELVADGDANIAEARYYAKVGDLGELSGSPDLVDVQHGILYDYKTNKKNPNFSYPWAEHGKQVNILRWLVDNSYKVEYNGETYLLDGSDPKALHRFRPMDWQDLVLVYMDDDGPKPLRVTKSEQVPKKDGNGTKAARVPDIWADDEALAFISEKYSYWQGIFENGELPVIPADFVGWEHPLCNFCPVRAECIDLEYGGAVPVELSVKRPRKADW